MLKLLMEKATVKGEGTVSWFCYMQIIHSRIFVEMRVIWNQGRYKFEPFLYNIIFRIMIDWEVKFFLPKQCKVWWNCGVYKLHRTGYTNKKHSWQRITNILLYFQKNPSLYWSCRARAIGEAGGPYPPPPSQVIFKAKILNAIDLCNFRRWPREYAYYEDMFLLI